MAGKKDAYGIGLLVILVAVFIVVLPFLRNMFAPSFPEGFRDLDCVGVNCREGEFCLNNKCYPNYVPTPSFP
jgi:hypothetical protein